MLSCLRGRAVMRSHNRHTSKTCTCRIRQHMRAHAHVQYDCTRAQTHKHTGHLDSSSARAAIWRSARRCSFAGHDTPKNLSLASSSVSECFWPSRYSYQGCVRTCMYMSHTCVCVCATRMFKVFVCMRLPARSLAIGIPGPGHINHALVLELGSLLGLVCPIPICPEQSCSPLRALHKPRRHSSTTAHVLTVQATCAHHDLQGH